MTHDTQLPRTTLSSRRVATLLVLPALACALEHAPRSVEDEQDDRSLISPACATYYAAIAECGLDGVLECVEHGPGWGAASTLECLAVLGLTSDEFWEAEAECVGDLIPDRGSCVDGISFAESAPCGQDPVAFCLETIASRVDDGGECCGTGSGLRAGSCRQGFEACLENSAAADCGSDEPIGCDPHINASGWTTITTAQASTLQEGCALAMQDGGVRSLEDSFGPSCGVGQRASCELTGPLSLATFTFGLDEDDMESDSWCLYGDGVSCSFIGGAGITAGIPDSGGFGEIEGCIVRDPNYPQTEYRQMVGGICKCVTRSDLNGDGSVDAADAAMMFDAWGMPGPTDLNDDGVTDAADMGILFADWTG